MTDSNTGNQTGGGEGFGEVVEREADETSGETKVETPVRETKTEGSGEETKEEPKVEPKVDSQEETKEDTTGETKEEPKTEVKLTDKGTKLDPDPLSAANQLLANERRKSKQLETVLSDPKLLAEYTKSQFGDSTVKSTEPEKAKEYTAADFESLDDVAKVINGLQASFAAKLQEYGKQIQELTPTVDKLVQGGRAAQVASTMSQDIGSLRGEPELDPKNPNFVEGLETDIAEAYHALDFDEKTGGYQGRHSLADIGKYLIEANRKGRKVGSEKAQTVVKDKTSGKVVTSPKVDDLANTDNMSAGDSIAEGISKMRF